MPVFLFSEFTLFDETALPSNSDVLLPRLFLNMPTQKEIDIYEELRPKIASVRDTIKALSSKKPDEILNLFKIRRINILIGQANSLLKDVKPYNDFDTFEEDELPSNSDVLLIIELYLESFHRYWINNSTHGSWDMEREWNITKPKKK